MSENLGSMMLFILKTQYIFLFQKSKIECMILMNKKYSFICHHGIRSRMVGIYFQQNGFKNTINLKGGIDLWAKTVDSKMPVY